MREEESSVLTMAVPKSQEELLSTIVSLLLPKETVPAALRRLREADIAPAAAAGTSASSKPTHAKPSWREQKAAREAARLSKTTPAVTAPSTAGDGAVAAADTIATPVGPSENLLAFNAVTEAADQLMTLGCTTVYQDRRESLERILRLKL